MDAHYAVQLTVPAQAGSARLARLMAAAVAADAGFTLDETEDLRVAVSELVSLLVEDERNVAGEVRLTYQRTSDSVEVTGTRTTNSAGTEPSDKVTPDDLALEILRVMVDEHDFTHDPSGCRFRLLKRTRAQA
jgi:hypothetical protein